MPTTRTWKDLKAPLAILLLIAGIMVLAYFSPPLVDVPEPVLPAQGESLPGVTSADLHRWRLENRLNALPPTDKLLAKEHLVKCEFLWNELLTFQDDPEFQKVRFSSGSRFARWRERTFDLYWHGPDRTILGSDIHRLAGAMLGVSNDFAGGAVHNSSQEEWFVNFYLPMAREAVSGKD